MPYEAPISSDVSTIAKALLASRASGISPADLAASTGAHARVVNTLRSKAAVGAGTLDDGDFGETLSQWGSQSQAFFATLQSGSAFFRLLGDAGRRVPLRTRVSVTSASATGWVLGEGKPSPISRLELAAPGIEPDLATAIVVVSREVAMSTDPAAERLVNAELRRAITAAVDDRFWSLLSDSNLPSVPSSGATAADMRTDLRALLDHVNVDGTGALIWVMAADVGNRAALIDQPNGGMTPTGGELLGLPALVSDQVPSGTLRLVDGFQVAVAADGLRLDSTEEADLEMLDSALNQDATTGTGASLVSMWQTNSVALRARISFAAEKLKPSAIAEVTSISWNG